jgi:hypothetical protein
VPRTVINNIVRGADQTTNRSYDSSLAAKSIDQVCNLSTSQPDQHFTSLDILTTFPQLRPISTASVATTSTGDESLCCITRSINTLDETFATARRQSGGQVGSERALETDTNRREG